MVPDEEGNTALNDRSFTYPKLADKAFFSPEMLFLPIQLRKYFWFNLFVIL